MMKLITTLFVLLATSAVCCSGFGEKRSCIGTATSSLHLNGPAFVPTTRSRTNSIRSNKKDSATAATTIILSTDLLSRRGGGGGGDAAAGKPKLTRWQKFAQNLFDETDVNNDGSVSFEEAYALVLQLYVKINRQAPIPPPTREKFVRQYKLADATHNNKLDKQEFTKLVGVVTNRALWRVLCVKISKIVGAPLLAELIIRSLAGKQWLSNLITKIVPTRFHENLLPVLTSTSFWRPVLLITLVISLGKVVLNIVNFFLDIGFPDHDE